MGRAVCAAVDADPDLVLAAAVDPAHAGVGVDGLAGTHGGPTVIGDLDDPGASADVVVDFTTAAVARTTLDWCVRHQVHAVVGTTGLSAEELHAVGRRFADAAIGCVAAANFAVGAVLMMRFAELAAPWFDGAEIVELHHPGKLDAPSGTARATAERMAEARASSDSDAFPPDYTETLAVAGARGGAGPAGVRIHSIRLPGLVAHQEVIFGALGQTLTIRHDSYDRASFMDGVVLAVRSVADRPGVTVGIESLLGL